MSASHPDLDLQGRIRPGLDILANEIVIGLKKRTRFHVNARVYQPGLVNSDPSVSLLNYELAQIERCHAELGRYTFAAQEAYSDVSDVQPVINRNAPESPIMLMSSGVSGRIVDFYENWIRTACPPGESTDTYGETVTADVVALLAIMERVNLGKAVAESKFQDLTDEFVATQGDRDEMLKLIVRRDREAQVVELAQRLADHYQLPPEHAVSVFKFMIAITIDIEIDYLRLRIADVS